MSFIGKYESEEDSTDKDITEEELVATFRNLHIKWEESYLTKKKHKKTINYLLQEKEKLLSTITGLEEDVTLLNSKLRYFTISKSVMDNDSNMVDVMIGNMKVVVFDYSSMNKNFKVLIKKFVSLEKKIEFLMKFKG